MNCHLCHRPIGTTTFVVQGFLGTYYECEWCFQGTSRPPEPELITDTFEERPTTVRSSLDEILDRLFVEL